MRSGVGDTPHCVTSPAYAPAPPTKAEPRTAHTRQNRRHHHEQRTRSLGQHRPRPPHRAGHRSRKPSGTTDLRARRPHRAQPAPEGRRNTMTDREFWEQWGRLDHPAGAVPQTRRQGLHQRRPTLDHLPRRDRRRQGDHRHARRRTHQVLRSGSPRRLRAPSGRPPRRRAHAQAVPARVHLALRMRLSPRPLRGRTPLLSPGYRPARPAPPPRSAGTLC